MICDMAAHKQLTTRQITDELNRRKIPGVDSRPWHESNVHHILRNEKYIGCNVWGKAQKKLGQGARVVPRDLWTRKAEAFPPLVDIEIF
jgi:Recombinase